MGGELDDLVLRHRIIDAVAEVEEVIVDAVHVDLVDVELSIGDVVRLIALVTSAVEHLSSLGGEVEDDAELLLGDDVIAVGSAHVVSGFGRRW